MMMLARLFQQFSVPIVGQANILFSKPSNRFSLFSLSPPCLSEARRFSLASPDTQHSDDEGDETDARSADLLDSLSSTTDHTKQNDFRSSAIKKLEARDKTLESLRSKYPAIMQEAAFAVLHVSGHQFKVIPGDRIITTRISELEVGDHITLNKILLIGTKEKSCIGMPIVEGARVHAEVEEHNQTTKEIIFKKRRRRNYRRTRGHRQEVTALRILAIEHDSMSADSQQQKTQIQHPMLH